MVHIGGGTQEARALEAWLLAQPGAAAVAEQRVCVDSGGGGGGAAEGGATSGGAAAGAAAGGELAPPRFAFRPVPASAAQVIGLGVLTACCELLQLLLLLLL